MEKMTDSIQHTLKQFAADSALTTVAPLCSDIPLFDINALGDWTYLGTSLPAKFAKLFASILHCIDDEGISQTELSKRCDVANYTMTRLLDQLQVQGLITRHQEADNRRAFQIFLTDEAKALEQDLICEAERVNEKFLSNLSDEEQQQFVLLLNKINRLA